MKKILFVNGGVGKFSEDFLNAGLEKGYDIRSIRIAHLFFRTLENDVQLFVNGDILDIREFDYVFIRVRGGYQHMSSLFLKYLQQLNIPHNDYYLSENTDTIEKSFQMILLPLGGVRIPDTWIFTSYSFKENKQRINNLLTFPLIFKFDGSQGKNVWKVNSLDKIDQILNEEKEGKVFMLQEMVPNDFDIRSLYAYGQHLGAIKRISIDGFYNNVSKGGKVEILDITEEEKVLVEKSCEIMRSNFAGVDIFRTESGPMVIEVNIGPQYKGFESATGKSVGREIFELIISEEFRR